MPSVQRPTAPAAVTAAKADLTTNGRNDKKPDRCDYCFTCGAQWSFGDEAAGRSYPPHTSKTCKKSDHTAAQLKVTPFNRTNNEIDDKIANGKGCPVPKTK